MIAFAVALGVLVAVALVSLADLPAGWGAGEGGHAEGRASDEQIRVLVDELGPLLYRVAYAVTHDRGLAEDVVQDALFQAWTSMPNWKNDVPLRWLRTVTRNRAISVMRKEARTVAREDWAGVVSVTPDVERVVEGREQLAAVRDALVGLDEQARLMIVLRETDELSYEEIAEVVELTPSAVKAKLYRARHTLKEELEAWEVE